MFILFFFHLLLPAQRLSGSYKLIKEIQFNSKVDGAVNLPQDLQIQPSFTVGAVII